MKKIFFIALLALLVFSCSSPEKEFPVDVVIEDATTTITYKDTAATAPNEWICFRKDFELQRAPSKAIAKIAVDSKYWLWVNGEIVVFEGALKRGPNPHDTYYDEVDLAPYLKKGSNNLALLLWYFGKDGFSHTSSGRAQLWFDCPSLKIQSDSTWMCRIHPAYGKADCPEPNFRLSETSLSFDARKNIGAWQTGPLEGFEPVLQIESTLGKLHSRPIPQWKDYGVKEAEIETHPGEKCDTVIAKLPHNMQMTPILKVSDQEGGHRILIETDHAKVGEECLRAEYITAPGEQEYESYGWLNGMKIILTVEHGAEVTGVAYRETGYDTTPEGQFHCCDSFYNTFWQKGLRTIYVNARDNFFDCPDRERGQWWGDIVTIMGECFYTYSTSLPDLARKGLFELVDWQRPDSVLFAPIPGNYGCELPVQSLAAIGKYGLWTYYMNTGDRAVVEHAYPAIQRYLSLYKRDESGITAFHDGDWNWGDWGENRDMRLLQSTWYCLATEAAANMATLLELPEDAQHYTNVHDSVCNAINRTCWTGNCYRHPEYKDSTDDRVQALAVLAGIAGPDKWDAIYEVFKKEEHASPYMEKYVMEALFTIGHGDYALERAHKRYRHMVEFPTTDTLFEGWAVGVNDDWDVGSVNHAWSGGPLAVLPTKMFGLVPTESGWKRFTIKPDVNIFNDCNLSFPTVRGTVAMSFKREGNMITCEVEVPKGSVADVTLPWDFKKAKVGKRSRDKKEFTLKSGKHIITLEV